MHVIVFLFDNSSYQLKFIACIIYIYKEVNIGAYMCVYCIYIYNIVKFDDFLQINLWFWYKSDMKISHALKIERFNSFNKISVSTNYLWSKPNTWHLGSIWIPKSFQSISSYRYNWSNWYLYLFCTGTSGIYRWSKGIQEYNLQLITMVTSNNQNRKYSNSCIFGIVCAICI